jgi:sigma-B regulation protein RsbU (phosphoserine phosphatase)
MSSLHAAIHAQVAARNSLPETIRSVNHYLSCNTPANRFVTLFMAELEPASGTLRYINAGHNPPLIGRSNGKIEQLESGGFPLGIIPTAEYEIGETKLNSGEVMVIYSDGVSEAVNKDGEEFGLQRLSEVIRKNLSASASGLRDKIESALTAFTQNTPASDDITLVVVRKK